MRRFMIKPSIIKIQNQNPTMIKYLKNALIVLAATGVMASCSAPKNIAYFQGANDAEILEVAYSGDRAIKVEPYDKLSITVSCKDPVLAQMFNLHVFTNSHVEQSSQSGTGTEFRDYSVGRSEGINGFTVSAAGTIDYPVIGEIKVEGMTRSELAAFIKGEIMGRGLIKDPVVTVEFLNVGVSVLGEVKDPGRYDLNTDVLTVVEALGLAGDITIQGVRDNVKVLRKEGDKMVSYTIDLTDAKKMLASPAYYMKQGDVVYVEPNNMKKRQATVNGTNVMNASFWLSVASFLTTAAVLFKK